MKKIELLSPVGNRAAFFAAINNGADAVYLGGTNFSARAFADNFTYEDIKELVIYAHLRNVKVYVTLNTLITDLEFPKVKEAIDKYYEYNVDALIIQDLGVYYYIKNKYPDFELHASTQMHVHNIAGIRVVKELGFKRVVLARESTESFIKEACQENIEIETFVHGAICVSYSGQCLLSSVSKNRSANKGMCAQCCRLKYDLLDENNHKIETDTDYLLSPKDMFLLNEIPSLIKNGVSSLKIEGRMKSSAYVGYVTKIYREAIDNYYANLSNNLNNDKLENLMMLYNRGFSNTYFKDNNENLFNQNWPNHQGVKIGEVINSNGKRCLIKLTHDLNQFDGVRISSKYFEDGFIVNKLYVNNKLVNKAYKNELIELESSHRFKKGDDLLLTLNNELEKSINNTQNKYLSLNLDIDIIPDENVKIIANVDDLKYEFITDIKPELANNAPLSNDNIIKQFSKLKETPYYLNNCSINTKNAFLRVSDLNIIRNNLIQELNNYRVSLFKRKTINHSLLFKNDNSEYYDELILKDNKINDYLFNDVINIDSKYHLNKEIISEIGGLLNDSNKIAFYTLNVSNSYAYEFLKRLGFKEIVLSTELNETQVISLIEEYKARNNILIKPFYLIEGHRSLMYLKRNPFINYQNYKYLVNNDIKLEIINKQSFTELLEVNSNLNKIDPKYIRPFIIL